MTTSRTWKSVSAALIMVGYCTVAAAQSESKGPWSGASLDFQESFEKATLNLNYDSGFRWGSSMNRSIVRDDQYIVWKGAPKMEGPFPNPSPGWKGFTGSHALMFSYPAGKNGFAEQRFSLGKAYPELWIGYWLRVPTNWEHGSANTNNKFFALWMDEYERAGPTGVIQTRASGGSSRISPYVRTRGNQHLGENAGRMLINVPQDRGRWMQVVIHAKMASSAAARDGKFELYRRWQGASEFEQIFAYDDWDNYHVGGNRGFAHGYIMGWANATQPASSEWLLDDFVVSSKSLLGAPSSETPGPEPKPEPKPEPEPGENTCRVPVIPNIMIP